MARYRGAFIAVMVMYPRPARINAMAQTISCFRLIMSMVIKMNDGMECIRNPPIWIRILSPVPNISNQNIVRKRMKKIARILGLRKRSFEGFVFMSAMKK